MITIMGITISAAVIWLVIAIIFGIIEACTMGIATIWFAGGAVVSAIAAMLGASVLIQVILFFAVSLLLLYFTRPLVKSKLKVGSEKTNTEIAPVYTGNPGVPERADCMHAHCFYRREIHRPAD